MNHYQLTRIADLRLQETARQARTAWWLSQPAPEETPMAGPSVGLHWVVPTSTRIAGT